MSMWAFHIRFNTMWFGSCRKLSFMNLLRHSQLSDGPSKGWFFPILLLSRNKYFIKSEKHESSIRRTKFCLSAYVQQDCDRCWINNEWITEIWYFKQLCIKGCNRLFSAFTFWINLFNILQLPACRFENPSYHQRCCFSFTFFSFSITSRKTTPANK